MIDRVSESGDIKPGHAGYRGTPRTGDHLSPAHTAVATDIFADSGSQRLSELCNLSEKQPLAKEPSRFRAKRQGLLEKYIFPEGGVTYLSRPLLLRRLAPKPRAGIRGGQA